MQLTSSVEQSKVPREVFDVTLAGEALDVTLAWGGVRCESNLERCWM